MNLRQKYPQWAGVCAALTLTALMACPSPGLAAVDGGDDRQTVKAQAFPWSTIGRLSKGDGSLCNAVLIGPDLALTVAHCLWNGRTSDWADAQTVFFSSGVSRAGTLAVSGVESYVVAGDYGGTPDQRLDNVAHDWALLHLREPLGERVGYLGVYGLSAHSLDAFAAGDPVILRAGYALPHRNVLRGVVGCPLYGWVQDGILAHGCDASPGDSGSPLLAVMDGVIQVIGLHASSFRDSRLGDREWSSAVPAGDFAPFVWADSRGQHSHIGQSVQWDQALWQGLTSAGIALRDHLHPLQVSPTPAQSRGHGAGALSGPGEQ